ncbi:class I SAM-dependent methyltransferase [Salinibacter ruber]|uniref:class I SAM-dependent methyltransferase n=1 Tax=Salinibacter ruber TaxID=146919 RepID=UPI00216A2409
MRYWSWGFRYLGGLQVVFDQLESIDFDSLIDVGCGDGRFLHEMSDRYPGKEILGVDYSRRAIDLAEVMSPSVEFRCQNILDDGIDERFDVAVLIEVFEHIPPDDLDAFVDATARLLDSGSTLIATIPHTNKWVSDKHYQHFNQSKLQDLLAPHFTNTEFFHIDDISSTLLEYLQSLVGGDGEHFVVTDSRIMTVFWRLYRRHYLYTTRDRCGRIAVVAEKE